MAVMVTLKKTHNIKKLFISVSQTQHDLALQRRWEGNNYPSCSHFKRDNREMTWRKIFRDGSSNSSITRQQVVYWYPFSFPTVGWLQRCRDKMHGKQNNQNASQTCRARGEGSAGMFLDLEGKNKTFVRSFPNIHLLLRAVLALYLHSTFLYWY